MKNVTVVKCLLASVLAVASFQSLANNPHTLIREYVCHSNNDHLLVVKTPSGVLEATVNDKLAFVKVPGETPVKSKGVAYTVETFEGVTENLRMSVATQDNSNAPAAIVAIGEPNSEPLFIDKCYKTVDKVL